MNIIILGQQGSGKGTQAELLAKRFNLDHFDVGRALRQVCKTESQLGKEVYEIIMVRKELVPSRILREVLHIRLASLAREQGVVFDGVPRNLEQAKYFEEALLEFGRKIDKVFFVNIGEKESIERISKRWACEKCKTTLIMRVDVKDADSKCPKCNNKIMQREDDTISGIKKRLNIFAQETMPVINYYKKQGVLVKIDGEQSVENVSKNIIENIKN